MCIISEQYTCEMSDETDMMCGNSNSIKELGQSGTPAQSFFIIDGVSEKWQPGCRIDTCRIFQLPASASIPFYASMTKFIETPDMMISDLRILAEVFVDALLQEAREFAATRDQERRFSLEKSFEDQQGTFESLESSTSMSTPESERDDIFTGEINSASLASLTRCSFAERFMEGVFLEAYRECWKDSAALSPVLTLPARLTFNIENGTKLIENILSHWSLPTDAMCHVRFSECREDGCCEYYEYEALFGSPSSRCPVPQITAVVYFTISVSRVGRSESSVELTYRMEGLRQRLCTEEGSSEGTFLLTFVVNAKARLFERITAINSI